MIGVLRLRKCSYPESKRRDSDARKLPNLPPTPGDIHSALCQNMQCKVQSASIDVARHVCEGCLRARSAYGLLRRRMSGARTHESKEFYSVRSDIMEQLRNTRDFNTLAAGSASVLTTTCVFRRVAAFCMTSRLSLDLEVLQHSKTDFVVVTIRPQDRSCQSAIHCM